MTRYMLTHRFRAPRGGRVLDTLRVEPRAGRCGSGCGDADLAYRCRAVIGSHELGVAIPVGEGTQIIPSSTRYRGCGSDKTGGGEDKSKELNDGVVDV
ncbi:hypothetical protein CUMW_195890 [Citrus unshiu]|nr:hypothetical protein CUMW_195890 [Citrus unshiu]